VKEYLEETGENHDGWRNPQSGLRDGSRRALVQLMRGPYLSAARHSKLWTSLLGDEAVIRERLSDLYLELVTDHASQVAFVRNLEGEPDAPKVMRTAALTFLDTAMLLHLRQQLLHESGSSKTIVGRDEVYDQLQIYRGQDKADPAGFNKRIEASWSKMVRYGLLVSTSTEDRFEVSPVLRLVFGVEQIAAVRTEFQRLAAETLGGGTPAAEDVGTVDDGERP
jgi:Domain of unknown function (DUF4194)